MSKPSIVIITGEPGCGKTSLCQKLSERAHQRGLDVAGVVSPAGASAPDQQIRVVEDLRTGERRTFARRPGPGPGRGSTGWRLDPEGLAWGAGVLREATPCDLLVVDELGPLELQGGQGWVVALDGLRSARYRLAVVVVRPGLVDVAKQRLAVPVQELSVTTANRDDLLGEIIALMPGGH